MIFLRKINKHFILSNTVRLIALLASTFSLSAAQAEVATLTNISAVDASGYHSCALISDGTVKCWGKNDRGQLGNNLTDDSEVAVKVVIDDGLPPIP